MKRVWTPWRMEYILSLSKSGCVFCSREDPEGDEPGFIIDRTVNTFTILNIYPYAVGHLMVCPFRHVGTWGDLTGDERRELLNGARTAAAALKRIYHPAAIHVGANLGRSSGAGIEGHLHLHLVPWGTDYPLDDPDRQDIETLPEPLRVTYDKLRAAISGA